MFLDIFGVVFVLKYTDCIHREWVFQKRRPIKSIKQILGGDFKHFLCSPLLGEMIQFDEYFSNGLKPPTRIFEPFSDIF